MFLLSFPIYHMEQILLLNILISHLTLLAYNAYFEIYGLIQTSFIHEYIVGMICYFYFLGYRRFSRNYTPSLIARFEHFNDFISLKVSNYDYFLVLMRLFFF